MVNSVFCEDCVIHEKVLIARKMNLPLLCLFGFTVISQCQQFTPGQNIPNYNVEKHFSLPFGWITAHTVAPGEIKYHTSLYNKNNGLLFCAGSLINPLYVVTAAHCVYGRKAEDMIVVAGTTNVRRFGDVNYFKDWRYIREIIVHNRYNVPKSCYNDIALLRLMVPYNITKNLRYVNLPILNASLIIEEATLTGYGKITVNGPAFSYLMRDKVYILKQTLCVEIYQRILYNITQHQICDLRSRSMRNIIESGSPLVVANILIAIESCAPGFQNHNLPAVFTLLSPYLLWIDSNINIRREDDNYPTDYRYAAIF